MRSNLGEIEHIKLQKYPGTRSLSLSHFSISKHVYWGLREMFRVMAIFFYRCKHLLVAVNIAVWDTFGGQTKLANVLFSLLSRCADVFTFCGEETEGSLPEIPGTIAPRMAISSENGSSLIWEVKRQRNMRLQLTLRTHYKYSVLFCSNSACYSSK